MTDVFDAIIERRSIRKYKPHPTSQELIKKVLTAAGWAPSAHNAQPYRFIVLKSTSIKRELAEAMAEAWAVDMAREGAKIETEIRRGRAERFAAAPVLVLACLSMDGMRKFIDEKRQMSERDSAVQSLGAALQNLLLAAHAKGLGACWFCAPAFCRETVRKVLSIPADVEPEALIALGYPAEKPPVPHRKLLSDFCFKDKWGRKLS
jgi:coenzyme F420-0:L-glutamate ligase/coenzyme F420-1:gamma-L-glutamate ligase